MKKDVISEIARKNNITRSTVILEIEKAIDAAINCNDSEKEIRR